MKTDESFEVKFNIKTGETSWELGKTTTVTVNVNKGRKMYSRAEEKFMNIEDYREKVLKKELNIVSISHI